MKCPRCDNDDPQKMFMAQEPIVSGDGKTTGFRNVGMRCAVCEALLQVTVGAIEEVDGPAAV